MKPLLLALALGMGLTTGGVPAAIAADQALKAQTCDCSDCDCSDCDCSDCDCC